MPEVSNIPEVRFEYGFLLDDSFLELKSQIPNTEKIELPPYTEIKEMIASRHKTWKSVENEILVGMQSITGLSFYQHLIDVYFVFGYKKAFSDPMVLSFKYEGEKLVDVLTHEIIHRILTDNTQRKDGSVWARNNYPDQTNRVVTNHILVHAIHKEIYLNIVKSPDRLKNDIDFCQNFPAYKTAWDIVEKEGHIEIINRFKRS